MHVYCGMQPGLFKTSILFLPKTLNFNMKEMKIHFFSKRKEKLSDFKKCFYLLFGNFLYADNIFW